MCLWGREGGAEEVANVIAFLLASEAASYVTGVGINVDRAIAGVT